MNTLRKWGGGHLTRPVGSFSGLTETKVRRNSDLPFLFLSHFISFKPPSFPIVTNNLGWYMVYTTKYERCVTVCKINQ